MTTTTPTVWRVYCADGVTRHEEDFASKPAADRWLTWRHLRPCPAGTDHRTTRLTPATTPATR